MLIPFFIGIHNLNKIEKQHQLFFYFIVFSCLFELLVFITNCKGINNFALFHCFLYCDLLFFAWFFQGILKNPKNKRFFILATGLVLFALLLNELLMSLNFPVKGSRTFFFLIGFFYFVVQNGIVLLDLFENSKINPTKNYLFWISFARLFYFLIIFFVYFYQSFADVGLKSQLFGTVHYITNAIGNITCNILYAISFLCLKTTK